MASSITPMSVLETAGRLIIENGGETFRAEDTIDRMGAAIGLQQVSCFAIPTGIFISYLRDDGSKATSVLRVRSKGTDFSRVDAVNSVSRSLAAGEYDWQEAMRCLQAIEARPLLLNAWQMVLASALTTGGFCLMFGGGWTDVLIGAAVGILLQLFNLVSDRLHMGNLSRTLIGSLIICLIPLQLNLWTGIGSTVPIIAGGLMPLLPGLAMTKAVQDILRGDMISGSSNLLNATLTAALIACGALFATALTHWMGGMVG